MQNALASINGTHSGAHFQSTGWRHLMSINIQNHNIDPTCWLHGDWAIETSGEALQRAPTFARDFFARLFGEFSELQHEILFLCCSAQPEDLFAVVDRSPGGVAVQIDPLLEYIIVHDDTGTGEYGDWGNGFDRIEEALKQIRVSLNG